MPKDNHQPATKKDVRLMQKDMRTTQKDLRKEMKEMEKRITTNMDWKLDTMETRLVQHFNVVAEKLVHDFNGIFKDRLEQHEDRIIRLEQHTGLARV
ncbi:MAG: hypothetical protein Q7R81_06390 [Candidatus Peregrinibacteria bacterium]|nr:hypothetical protein [Candidatus Peregrinibacteria bacterium]